MELKENDTMKDVLMSAQAQDQPVYIQMKSGTQYMGTIQKVGRNCVSLKLIGDRSFYDAIIRIEEIAVVEIQVRG